MGDFKDPGIEAEKALRAEFAKTVGEPLNRPIHWAMNMEMTVRVTELQEMLTENKRLREQVTALQDHNTKLAEAGRAAKRAGTAGEARTRRQKAVGSWVRRCFGERSWTPKERSLRVLEEAVELAQAAGVSPVLAGKLVEYVYNRPVGDIASEVSGVAVTLLAFAQCTDLNADAIEAGEIERVLALPESFFEERYERKIAAGMTTVSASETR